MIKLGYCVVERFGPESGDAWTRYVTWSGLGHLAEVVGLDSGLCPSVLREYEDEDWNQLAFDEHLFGAFHDLAYALRRNRADLDARLHQVLAVSREPFEVEMRDLRVPDFQFMGFELIEEATSTSALTNCGGFAGAFNVSAPVSLSRRVSRDADHGHASW